MADMLIRTDAPSALGLEWEIGFNKPLWWLLDDVVYSYQPAWGWVKHGRVEMTYTTFKLELYPRPIPDWP